MPFRLKIFEASELRGLDFDTKCRFECILQIGAVFHTDTVSHQSTVGNLIRTNRPHCAFIALEPRGEQIYSADQNSVIIQAFAPATRN
jgi:hypothetical protein